MHTVLPPQRHHCTHNHSLTQAAHTLTLTHMTPALSQTQEDRSADSPAWPLAPSVLGGLSTSQEVTAGGGRCSLSLEGPRRELLATLRGLRTWGAPYLLCRGNIPLPLALTPGVGDSWAVIFLSRAQFDGGEGGSCCLQLRGHVRDQCMVRQLLLKSCEV